ncbi:unnamed protein product [Protopolystoma xenopodis]|uniref:Uncharacterized protein n=1 Tax=Protopolystoma xenopodis TaxID=117903 RepID=A0A3S5A140_9PLAT|nr:unnamed protein product [Protopolystoma xenopodis]
MIESSNLVSPEGASVGPFEIKSPITSTPGCPKSPEIVRMNWGSITIGTEISGVTVSKKLFRFFDRPIV